MLTSPYGWDPYGIDSLQIMTQIITCTIFYHLTQFLIRIRNPLQVKLQREILPSDLVSS